MATLPFHVQLNDERFRQYKENRQLYQGEAYDVFGMDQYSYYKTFNPQNPKLSYINYNMFALISELYADMSWSEAPEIRFRQDKVQDWFDTIREASSLDLLMYESTLATSYYGDVPVKVGVRKDPKNSSKGVIKLDQVS